MSKAEGGLGDESGRERVLKAAYELFSNEGTRTVGVDTVIARANVAKMTLYRNFPSKQDLVLAFLERREENWTREWLQQETLGVADDPVEQLLSIFDLFGRWFAEPDFEGCAFIRVLLEVPEGDNAVRSATVQHLATIRMFLRDLAAKAGIADPEGFAHQWHILMKGSIIAAHEGDVLAASRAKELGELLLRSHGLRG